MAEDFIKNPDFQGLRFISHSEKFSFVESHHLSFLSDQRVKWRRNFKFNEGINSSEEWIGKHAVNVNERLVTFQFETSEWFHQVPYRYYHENILKRGCEPMISLVPDCDGFIKFNGPCDENGEPDIRNLNKRRLS